MISDQGKLRLSWIFVAVAIVSAIVLFIGYSPVIASNDHEELLYMKNKGDIISLSELIAKAGLENERILEAELEREHGQLVYELEILDAGGRVYERYYNAITGELLNGYQED